MVDPKHDEKTICKIIEIHEDHSNIIEIKDSISWGQHRRYTWNYKSLISNEVTGDDLWTLELESEEPLSSLS